MLAIHASFPLIQIATAPLVRPSLTNLKQIASNPKAQEIALHCIQGVSSLYLSSFGAFELTQALKGQEATTQKAEGVKQRTFSSSASYLALHGACMLGSGASYLFDLLNKLGVVYQHVPSSYFAIFGNVSFLCANLCALEENLRLYRTIMNAKDETDPRQLHSICWGIASNAGYILAMGALLFGYANAVTLLIAVLSCLAGGIKILYDVMILLGKEKPGIV